MSPSAQHKCEKGAAEEGLKGDCFRLRFVEDLQESFTKVVQKADALASVAERRAERTGTSREWRRAARQRAQARTVAAQALLGIAQISGFARDTGWEDSGRKALALRLLAATRSAIAQRERRMVAQARADLLRVRRPRLLPSFGSQTRRVRAADRKRRAAHAAARRITGTLPSTVPTGGDLAEVWDEYSRRIGPIAGLITRISGPLGRAMPRRERVRRLALLRELVTIYRNEGRQFESRVKATSGACRAKALEHLDNTSLRVKQVERYLRAFQDGEIRFVRSARTQYRKRGARGRTIANAVRRCLAGETPPPAPVQPSASVPGDGPAASETIEVGVTPVPIAEDPPPEEDPLDVDLRRAQEWAADRLAATAAGTSTGAFPFYTSVDAWVTGGGATWISGFFPGSLWLEHQRSGNASAAAGARARQDAIVAAIAAQLAADPGWSSHDVGFMLMSSLGNGYRLTREDTFRQQILARAPIVSDRYVPAVGAIRAFAGSLDAPEVNVITDTMMNLEILLWGARNGGDPEWRTRAIAHALTTRNEHIRDDGSTYHVVVFDAATGAVLRRSSRGQGHSTSSVWSRGQAWAMHGFTMVYRETGDARFLDAARRTSDYFLAHLPADGVPYWDFLDPAIPSASRDSSAAAIAASGLLELSRIESDPARAAGYLDAARRIMHALASGPYLSQGTPSPAVLLHGTYNFHAGTGIDAGLSWGDHYFLEAMLRHRLVRPGTGALPVAGLTASADDGNVPANVLDDNLGTRWSARGDGQWIRIDLGAPRMISKLAIAFERGDERAARIEIATSDDGQSWTTHATPVSVGTTRAQETFDIPDTRARFVRVLGRGNSANDWNSITELDVH